MTNDYTTTNVQLEQLMQKHLGNKFRGVYSKDEALPPNVPGTGYIVNLQDSDAGGGTHWLGVTHNNKESFFYDPYGIVPSDVIIKHIKNGGTGSGRATTQTKRPIIYSDMEIQQKNSTTCGYHVMSWLNFMTKKGLPTRQRYYDYLYKYMEPYDSPTNEKKVKKEFGLT